MLRINTNNLAEDRPSESDEPVSEEWGGGLTFQETLLINQYAAQS